MVRRSWTTAGLLALVALGATTVFAIPALYEAGSSVYMTVVGGAEVLFTALGLIFATWASRLPGLPPRIRRAWRWMLPTYALWLADVILYGIFPGQPFPSLPEVGQLLIAPVTLAGILAFTRIPGSRTERIKLWLDAGVVAVGSAMVLWFMILSPALAGAASATWRELTPSIARPLLDAALLFGVGVVLLQGAEAVVARLPLTTVVAAILLIMIGDMRRAYVVNHGGSLWPSPDQTMFWVAGLFMLMLAPYLQVWRTQHRAAPEAAAAPTGPPRWPYLTAIPGYLLLMFTVGVEHPYPASGLIAGAFLVSTLVFGRQMVAARENRRMAVTDQLTGLANRVQMYEALPRAMARAHRNHTLVAVMVIDMNGFKQINDEFGHQAGDQLLIGFGRLLRRCVLGSDLVVRLGGDEFAIVLPDLTDPGHAQAVVQRIRAAMAEPVRVGSTVVQPSASIGVAFARPGDHSVDDLLHRADVAMYDAKKKARPTTPPVLHRTVPGTSKGQDREPADNEN
ncbi:diguanylate cyclase domain-containing protein [Actinoplanes subglobosus]|uniref:Diguanylate cyclase domain-containing protein n=1 Tax=Actinoplanes subglobosus TaxID=1547892 RepID=A0ABV8J612_9ACTN